MSVEFIPNEPARLLLGQAALGRLKLARDLERELDFSCLAKPFELDVRQDDVLEIVHARRLVEAKRKAWYLLLLMLVFVIIGAGAWFYLIIPVVIAGYIHQRHDHFDATKVAIKYHRAVFDPSIAQFENKDQNLIIFRGDNPFDNFGLLFGNWNLVVDASRRKADEFGEHVHRDIDLNQLEMRIKEEVGQAGKIDDIRSLYFVDGRELPREIMVPGARRPPSNLQEEKFRSLYGSNPNSPVRRYLWIRRTMWKRNVSISYFLRITKHENDISIEISSVFLPPISQKFRRVDSYVPRSAAVEYSLNLVQGAKMLIWAPIWFGSQLDFGALLMDPEKAHKAMVKNTPNFNYGAPLCIRRRAADANSLRFFQELDRRSTENAFAGRITRAFVDFLDEHGVDTSELREQRTTLLNQGIVVQGGDLKAKNVAAGVGAMVKTFTAAGQHRAGGKDPLK